MKFSDDLSRVIVMQISEVTHSSKKCIGIIIRLGMLYGWEAWNLYMEHVFHALWSGEWFWQVCGKSR